MPFNPIRLLGRALLASPFIILGYQAAREPGGRVKKAAALGVPEPKLAVEINGWTMVAAGIALALGMLSRWMAAVLALVLIPTTLAGHPYWKETEPAARQQQFIHFLKNLSMIGGLLLLATRHRT